MSQLIFCFFKCCADMSQRPQRTDILRLGRESSTGSSRREKQALRPPPHAPSRQRGGPTRFGGDDVAGGSLSQTGLSQMVDPTQYQY